MLFHESETSFYYNRHLPLNVSLWTSLFLQLPSLDHRPLHCSCQRLRKHPVPLFRSLPTANPSAGPARQSRPDTHTNPLLCVQFLSTSPPIPTTHRYLLAAPLLLGTLGREFQGPGHKHGQAGVGVDSEYSQHLEAIDSSPQHRLGWGRPLGPPKAGVPVVRARKGKPLILSPTLLLNEGTHFSLLHCQHSRPTAGPCSH